MTRKLAKILLSLLLFVGAPLGIGIGLAPHAVVADIQFLHYLDAGLPEQDVFIDPVGERPAPPDPDFLGPHEILVPTVMRVEGKSALTPVNLDKPLYASALIAPHDRLKKGPNPLGPYDKGDRLGFTLRQWLAAQGSGTYAVGGADAESDLAFQQLVPGGRYALWCGRWSSSPSYSESEKACGAPDGSQNLFKADGQGNATFHLHLKALPASTEASTTVLTLTYERDVETLEGGWGGYGLSSHAQLFYAFRTLPDAAINCGGRDGC